jgi:hypothetical protein
LAQVLAVALALQAAVEEYATPRVSPVITEVKLADLVKGTGVVALNDDLSVAAAELADICSGDAPTLNNNVIFRRGAHQPDGREGVWQVLQRSGLPEDRLLRWLRDRGLVIDRIRLAEVSFALWQSTFSDERDRRAGPGARPQKKGRISRELRVELEKALGDGDD